MMLMTLRLKWRKLVIIIVISYLKSHIFSLTIAGLGTLYRELLLDCIRVNRDEQ